MSDVFCWRQHRRLSDGQQHLLRPITIYVARVITGIVDRQPGQVQRSERVQWHSGRVVVVVVVDVPFDQQKSVSPPNHLQNGRDN